MTRCRVEQDELDYDTQQGQWEPVKSIFDYEPEPEYSVDTDHATEVKPDKFELDMARQEKDYKDKNFDAIFNRIMKGNV